MHYLFVVLILFFFPLPPVLATEQMVDKEQQAIDEFLALKLKVDYSSMMGMNVNQGGGYDIDHSKIEVGNFLLSFAYESFSVNWQDQADLPFATGVKKPLSNLHRYHLQAHVPYRLDDKRMWLGHVGAEWAFEEDVSDSLSLQSYLLYSEKLDKKSSWQLGVYANYHPVGTILLPIFEYTYNYPFIVRAGYYGHIGFPKTQLGYHLNSNLRTDFGLIYHQAIAKLADDSPIEAGGFFHSKNWRASWQVHYRFTKKLEARFGLQADISNQLVLYDRSYKERDHFYIDQGKGWNLGVSYQF